MANESRVFYRKNGGTNMEEIIRVIGSVVVEIIIEVTKENRK